MRNRIAVTTGAFGYYIALHRTQFTRCFKLQKKHSKPEKEKQKEEE